MKLEYIRDRFIFTSTYEEYRGVQGTPLCPKTAGFRYDREGKCWFTDFPETAKKLKSLATLETLKKLGELDGAKIEAIEASKAVSSDMPIPCPNGLSYLPFQRAGIEYAVNRAHCLIGDEMGLGKTIQALGVANLNSPKSILIVCPASLKINWSRECNKWLVKHYPIQILEGRSNRNTSTPRYDDRITICNYEILSAHKLLKEHQFDLIILDESHYIKERSSKRTKATLELKGKQWLYLSGTPILNRPYELYPIMQNAGLYHNFFRFAARYCQGKQGRFGYEYKGASNLGELQELLRSKLMVRRLKADVLKELPAKRRQVIALPWSAREQMKDQSIIESIKDRARQVDRKDLAKFYVGILSEIAARRKEVALQKVQNGALEIIDNHLLEQDKLVIFCHHHDVIDALSAELTAKNIQFVRFTGRNSQDERDLAVRTFRENKDCKIFLGSIKAAGVGLTLTEAKTVLFFELSWTPSDLLQSEDRIHRIGQTDSVLCQYLVYDGSIDNMFLEAVESKLDTISSTLDSSSETSLLENILSL